MPCLVGVHGAATLLLAAVRDMLHPPEETRTESVACVAVEDRPMVMWSV